MTSDRDLGAMSPHLRVAWRTARAVRNAFAFWLRQHLGLRTVHRPVREPVHDFGGVPFALLTEYVGKHERR